MKKKRKFLLASLLAGTSIVTSLGTSVSCKIAKNGYVGMLYNVSKDSIIKDYDSFDFGEEVFLKYPAFSCKLVSRDVATPIYEEMVPQGLTIMDDYILTTSYDHSGQQNSMVYVLERNGCEINQCLLDVKSHVGGICFDRNNSLVWIPANNGRLNAYRADDFVSMHEIKPVYSNLDVGNGLLNYKYPWKNSIAYLTIYKDELYIGSFSLVQNGLVKKYSVEIDTNRNVSLKYKNSFKVPTRVQGLSFYSKDEEDYIIFSRSFGKNNPSLLQIFSYNDEIKDYSSENLLYVSYEAPAMMEQVTINDDMLYSIFESGASAYSGCVDQLDNICVLDAQELVGPLKQKRH